MKKLCPPYSLHTFFSHCSVHRDGGLYSRAFRMVRHSQQSRWTSYLATRLRAQGRIRTRAWESRSLPIGNGSLGANIMGSISAERITLNEKTLWKGGPNTAKGAEYYWNVNKQSAGVLKEIRQAFLDGDSQKGGVSHTRKLQRAGSL